MTDKNETISGRIERKGETMLFGAQIEIDKMFKVREKMKKDNIKKSVDLINAMLDQYLEEK